VAGSSAGGHMAAMAALTLNDPAFQLGFEHADTSSAPPSPSTAISATTTAGAPTPHRGRTSQPTRRRSSSRRAIETATRRASWRSPEASPRSCGAARPAQSSTRSCPGPSTRSTSFTRSSLRRSSTASRTSPPGCAPTQVGLCEQRHEEETAALAGVSGLPGRPVLKAGRPRMCETSLCPATTVTPARGSTRLSRPPCGEPRPRSGSPAQLGADAPFPMKRNSESPAQAPSRLRRGARPSGRRSRPSLPSRARSPRAAVPRRFGSSASRCGRRPGL
jgi:hypothetical protein